MKTTQTIPESSKEYEILEFKLQPNDPNVSVILMDPELGRKKVNVDITTEWLAASEANKTIIKAFFKIVGAMAIDEHLSTVGVDVIPADITDDLWDVVV